MANRSGSLPKSVRDFFARFGSIGGKRRAARMKREERVEAARRAVRVRWAKRRRKAKAR